MTNEEAIAMMKKNPISFGCGALSFVLAVGLYLRAEALPDAEAELTQKSAAAERIGMNIKYSAQLKEQADAQQKYLSLTEAAEKWLKIEDADARYIKLGQAVMGDGSVFTGFKSIVGPDREALLQIPTYLKVEAFQNGPGEGTSFELTGFRQLDGQVQFALADGSVQFLNEGTAPGVVGALVSRQGGEVFNDN